MESQYISLKTQRCVSCGGAPETFCGHVHGDVQFGDIIIQHSRITAGWCDECHAKTQTSIPTDPHPECEGEMRRGCYGEWKPEHGLQLWWYPPEDL